MSLEESILKLTTAVERQNELLEAVLANDGGAAGAEGEETKKRTRRTKAEIEAEKKAAAEATAPAEETKAEMKAAAPAADESNAGETLKAKLSAWLSEFPKEHPEPEARRAKLKEVIGKLGCEKLPEVLADATKTARLDKWFEEKAKTADNGFGVGRFAADPAAASNDDDDL